MASFLKPRRQSQGIESLLRIISPMTEDLWQISRFYGRAGTAGHVNLAFARYCRRLSRFLEASTLSYAVSQLEGLNDWSRNPGVPRHLQNDLIKLV